MLKIVQRAWITLVFLSVSIPPLAAAQEVTFENEGQDTLKAIVSIPPQEKVRLLLGYYTTTIGGDVPDFGTFGLKLSFPLVGENNRLHIGGFVGRASIEGAGGFIEYRHLLNSGGDDIQLWLAVGSNVLARKNYDLFPIKRTEWYGGLYMGLASAFKIGSRRAEIVIAPGGTALLDFERSGSLVIMEKWYLSTTLSINFTIL
ncbi:MAG: hypothetical protein Q7S84_00190 [bacterium]|nr:hypothetical protein [bacterium]